MVLKRFSQAERPVLVAGLAVRVLLLLLAVPVTYQEWFLPFLLHAGGMPTVDPWTRFLAAGGDPAAFPYGPLYVLVFSPLTLLGGLVSPRAAALGLGTTVLLLDVALFAVLRRLAGRELRPLVSYGYWASPIVLYVCYWHGQLDVFPILILATSLLFLRDRRFKEAGLALGLATAAKMSMAVGIAFVWIYVVAARRLRAQSVALIGATLAGIAVTAPFLLSPGFRQMVLRTPESGKVFALALQYGGLVIYITPIVFAALVGLTWRIRRFNFDTLFNLIGVGFFVLFLLTPASPGWSMWLMPFLALYFARTGTNNRLITLGFALLFVAAHLLTSSGATFAVPLPSLAVPPRALNLLFSLYVATGGMIAFQMLNHGLLRDPFYRNTRTPLALGIAGDSGTGKDTLAAALRGLFGAPATALVSGDDYHSWDRHKPMWRALTHLNPNANDLRRFADDLVALKSGYVIAVPHYDHTTGRMTKPHRVNPTDVIIASGLHALHDRALNEAFDLRIFLSMEEDLRVFLKLRRDVKVRGHSLGAVKASIASRLADAARYIQPQAAAADIELSLIAIDKRAVADPLGPVRPLQLGLRIRAPAGKLEGLARVLLGIAGLGVVPSEQHGASEAIEVIGDPTAADTAAAAAILVPAMPDYLAITPVWAAGMMGVMQLAILDQLSQRLSARKSA